MDLSTEMLARSIGYRVKQERQARQWTLDQLATHSGLSRRMLVNVEQGNANPSVGTLLRLSEALDIGLPALVEPPTPKQVKLTRSGEGAALWQGDLGGRGVLMAGTASPDVLELWDWTLMPGERHSSSAHAHGTWELLQVLAGGLTIHVGPQVFLLAEGDALSFPGDVPHIYLNAAAVLTRFTLTVFEPGAGATHQRRVTGS